MVTYLIKSTLCLALFLAFYHLVLEREKMHRFNRYYLLGSVFISFLAPLYTIYTKAIQKPIVELTQLPDNAVFTQEIFPIKEPVNYWNYVLYFSIGISILLLLKFFKNLYSIYRKVKISEKFKYQNSTIVLVADTILPHTFWNYIFINKAAYKTKKIEQELFTHELTHVAQKHTFDVLLIELLKVVFWFNPIFYFLKKSVQLNHEFLADTNVVSQHKNISKYQHLLINTSAWSNEYALASNLHYLVTKKRIVMMTKQTSKAVIRLKKLAVLPLIIGAIFLFAERVEAQETIVEQPTNVQKTKNTSTNELQNEKIIEVLEDKKPSKTNNFLASVERTGNTIQLKCYDCYRWADLKLKLNTEYIINDFGFSEGKTLERDKYAFTIKATRNNVIFKGLKNTAWKDLKFTLQKGNKQFFNQYGTVSKKENKKYLNTPAKRKSSKQNISPNFTLKKSIKKDTIKKPINVKNDKLSASKIEMNEYNSILNKIKKNIRFIKQKDVLKLQSLYSSMSEKQKNSVEDYRKILPPSIPMDMLFTYKRLVKKVQSTSKNRKANMIYLNELYSKMSPVQKKLVIEPSKILPPPPPTKKSNNSIKDGAKKGWFQANNQTLYFVKEKGKTTYYNRWGNEVDKTGTKLLNGKNKKTSLRDSVPSKTGFEQVGRKVYAYKTFNNRKYYFDDKTGKQVSVKHSEPLEYDEMINRLKNSKKEFYIENKKVTKEEFRKTKNSSNKYYFTGNYIKNNTVFQFHASKSKEKIEKIARKNSKS